MEEYLALAVRISIMYVYILAVIRISGKRTIDSLTPFDFVIGIMIGDLFDDIFWNEVALSQALTACTTLFVLHLVVAYASYRSTALHHLVSSVPSRLVKNGRFVEPVLEKERTPKDEVRSELRLQKEELLKDLEEAFMEPGGQVSMIKRESAKTAQKKDLPRLKELFR